MLLKILRAQLTLQSNIPIFFFCFCFFCDFVIFNFFSWNFQFLPLTYNFIRYAQKRIKISNTIKERIKTNAVASWITCRNTKFCNNPIPQLHYSLHLRTIAPNNSRWNSQATARYCSILSSVQINIVEMYLNGCTLSAIAVVLVVLKLKLPVEFLTFSGVFWLRIAFVYNYFFLSTLQ